MLFDLLWSYSTLTFKMYVYFDLLRVQAGGCGLSWEVLECISASAQSLGYLCSFGNATYVGHFHKLVMRTVVNKREGLPVGSKDYF